MGKLASFSQGPRDRQQAAEQSQTESPEKKQQHDEAHDAQALTDALKGGDQWNQLT